MIESKGLFTVENRKKHIYIKEQHPELDVRFVFSNANSRLRKGSPTSYSMWCDKQGFKWAHKIIPQEWFDEVKEPKDLDAIINKLKGFK